MMNTGRFPCPKCAGVFEVDATTSSGKVRCPHCQEVVRVPGSPAASPSKPPPPPASASRSRPPVPSGVSPEPPDTGDMLPEAIDGTTGQAAGASQPLAGVRRSTGHSSEQPVITMGLDAETGEWTQRPADGWAVKRRKRNFWLWIGCLALIFCTLALLLHFR